MVKHSQKLFIGITSLILLIVFSIIFFVSSYLLKDSFNHITIVELKEVYNKVYSKQMDKLNDNELVITFNDNRRENSIYNIHISNGEEVYSSQTINNILNSVSSKPLIYGSVNNIYYLVNGEGIEKTLVATDFSEKLEGLYKSKLKILFVLSVIYLLLVVLVYALSYKVFSPLKNEFIKQKQFFSDASHELKTPIAIISANVDVIKTTENNKYLDSIKNQNDRLKVLVNDMLTLSKTEERDTKIVKEEVLLTEELEKIVLPFESIAFESGKTLLIDSEPNLKAKINKQDFNKLIEILTDNAIKYSSKGGIIKFTLKKVASKIVLSVFNTGSEILDEDSNKIFIRFYRGDGSRSRESGGNGLGLAIAKTIADQNKWRISAKSKYGESMTITVIL